MAPRSMPLVVAALMAAVCIEAVPAAATEPATTTPRSTPAPASTSTPASAAHSAAVPAASERTGADRKKRARVAASWRRVGRGRVALTVRTKARKVRVRYRAGRARPRTVVVRVRSRRVLKALPRRARQIRVRAAATRTRRASRWVGARHVKAPRIWMADNDGNGIKDYYYDRQADGSVDAIFFDDNRNRRYEAIAIFVRRRPVAYAVDQDENGYLEAFIVDLDRNGRGERIYSDPDQDGYAQWQQIDTNADGYADTWVNTAPNVTSTSPGRQANNLMVRNIVTLNQLRQLDPWSLGYLPYDPAPSLLRD